MLSIETAVHKNSVNSFFVINKCKLLEIMVFMSYSESKLISSYYFIKVNI